jgi:hypothetical protein
MAPILYNSTGTIGEAITAFTTNIGGNIFLTLFILLLFIFLLAIVLRIPLEFGVLFLMPLLIILAAFNANFLALFGVALIYMGILFAKYYFTSR